MLWDCRYRFANYYETKKYFKVWQMNRMETWSDNESSESDSNYYAKVSGQFDAESTDTEDVTGVGNMQNDNESENDRSSLGKVSSDKKDKSQRNRKGWKRTQLRIFLFSVLRLSITILLWLLLFWVTLIITQKFQCNSMPNLATLKIRRK